MTIDDKFFDFLGTCSDGKRLQDVYNRYRLSTDGLAYELNGLLKSGLTFEKYPDCELILKSLKDIIRATNTKPLILYRMTSDTEFIGPLEPALTGKSFRYAAFMSTSTHPHVLPNFSRSAGTPLVLEIWCREGTAMGLMDAGRTQLEYECLLGCGTKFRYVGATDIREPEKIRRFVSTANSCSKVIYINLEVDDNPLYFSENSSFKFDPEDMVI